MESYRQRRETRTRLALAASLSSRYHLLSLSLSLLAMCPSRACVILLIRSTDETVSSVFVRSCDRAVLSSFALCLWRLLTKNSSPAICFGSSRLMMGSFAFCEALLVRYRMKFFTLLTQVSCYAFSVSLFSSGSLMAAGVCPFHWPQLANKTRCR